MEHLFPPILKPEFDSKTHVVEEENWLPQVVLDLHIYTVAWVYTPMCASVCTHIHN